ncbi:MAG: Sulfatase [uncultured Rubrobacteraceae bacterium]|uniref:Sulfatase n=1 Tax=uncultured Rubrobacteraceae bacterium TaxID=349277 RepID=A0A6J4QJK3_9ACTN|nr:MAG: Sulfatase [uncultured Rubrobacteraceae bacterium]
MNVILVILDSLRKDHLGVYGSDRVKTPNLDALADESFRFTRAHPESLPTICARRAIHTGLRTFPFRNRVELPGETFQPAGWQPIPEDQVTLSETLVAQEYNTVLFSDTQPMFHPSMNFQRGFRVFDWLRGQERDRYRPKSLAPEDLVQKNTVPGNDEGMISKVQQYLANTRDRKTEEDYFAPRLFARGMDFLDRSEAGQPFFLVLDSFDPHEPWDPPEEYAGMYSDGYDGRDPIVPNYGGSQWIQDAELERMRALYAGEVTMVDRWFGRFMEKMQQTGRADDTLLLVISDHGVALGEHGFTGKPFNALWPELTDIPFMIRHPEGLGAGETSDFFASTHDVAPTILGLLGLLPQQQMDGQYLSILMEGGDLPPRDHFTLGYADHVWARDDRYLMFSRTDRSEPHLYDLQNDPGANRNLADDDPDRVRRMFEDYVLADAGGSLDG